MNLKQTLTADTRVKTALAACRTAQAEYEAELERYSLQLWPDQTALALKLAISKTTDPAEMAALSQQLTSISESVTPGMLGKITDSAKEVQRRSESICGRALLKFRQTIPALLSAAESVLVELELNAHDQESTWLQQHGFNWEPLPLTRQVKQFAAEVRQFHGGLEQAANQISSGIVRGAFGHILDYFTA